jgi:hypothetical protein
VAQARDLRLNPARRDDYLAGLVARTEPTPRGVARAAAATDLISGVAEEELVAAIDEVLASRLPHVVDIEEIEPDLEEVAKARQWTYRPERARRFRVAVDDALRIDEEKVAGAIVSSGLVEGADEATVVGALRDMGGVDVQRRPLLMRSKTRRRLLKYHFRVPRQPDSPEFVRVTVSGPPEVLHRYVTRTEGGDYVFSIQVPAQQLKLEY